MNDTFNTLYYSILLFFRKIFYFIRRFFVHPTPIVPVIDPLAVYVQQYTTRFLEFVENPIRNQNIPSYFYSKKPFQEMVQDADNAVEPLWKQRVLMETTPRGNLVMYYDPYRFGFCYYADTATIPYSVLNSVAMKYVTVYLCADFFMDNEFPFVSPLIAVYQDDKKDKPSSEENTEKEKFMKELLSDGPFIKRKKKGVENNVLTTSKTEKEKEKETKKTVEFYRNKFFYLGKIHNYSFLKKEIIKPSFSNETTTFTSQFKGLFNYTDYKKMKML